MALYGGWVELEVEVERGNQAESNLLLEAGQEEDAFSSRSRVG